MTEADKTYTVVSTMKNEGPFILEWVAHYKTLGFDNIVVFTNDCEDRTVALLQRLEALGHVTHKKNKVGRGGIHRSALRQASRSSLVSEADWVFVCDVDEFLNIHVGDGSVRALVEYCGPEADVICVPWRIFGPMGQTKFVDERITPKFTMGEYPVEQDPKVGKFVKSLFRDPKWYKRIGLHMPIMPDEPDQSRRFVYPDGAPKLDEAGKRTQNLPTFEAAQVNHYALRTLDSYLVKRDRGRANHTSHVLGLEYWDKFDRAHIVDTSIQRYDHQVTQWIDTFKEDRFLAKFHRQSVRWHRLKAHEMRTREDIQDIVTELEKRAAMWDGSENTNIATD